MRLRRLKIGTRMDSGQIYHVYQNQAAAAYSSLYSFFFLSNFQHCNFSSLFSQELWGLEDWNLVHTDSGQMYYVYWNQAAAAAYSSHYFFIFLSLQFSTLKFLVTLSSGTLRLRRLKLSTHGHWAAVSCVPESGCCYLFIPLFLHFSFSPVFNIEIFGHTFLGNCEA